MEASRKAFGLFEKQRRGLARVIRGISCASNSLVQSKRWIVSSLLIGTVPLLGSFLIGIPGHGLVSAVMLSCCCIALCFEDRAKACIVMIAMVYLSHSALAIQLARRQPDICAKIMPQAADYWAQQDHWISTGENEEYELSTWVPAHAQLLLGSSFFSFSSFGCVVFYAGFEQVDMMNYYNAQLGLKSQSSAVSLFYGWHCWSIMRGIGYLFVVFESISLACQYFGMRKITTRQKRIGRWCWGIGFLLADCVTKYFLVDSVRMKLFENLQELTTQI